MIQVLVYFETPFHVGGGVTGEGALFKPLLKDALGRPYIPASTFKGRLRHEAERLVRALQGDAALCRSPHSETMCPQAPRFGKFCPICRTFGSPALPAPWYFGDLKVSRTDEQLVKASGWRYGVGLSRYRGVAVEKVLYATETAAAAPFLVFSTAIEPAAATGDADIVPGGPRSVVSKMEWRGMTALLLASLAMLNTLGSSRSRGLGWLKTEVSAPVWDAQRIKEELQAWLKSEPWR